MYESGTVSSARNWWARDTIGSVECIKQVNVAREKEAKKGVFN
jgi:hypothetical protein